MSRYYYSTTSTIIAVNTDTKAVTSNVSKSRCVLTRKRLKLWKTNSNFKRLTRQSLKLRPTACTNGRSEYAELLLCFFSHSCRPLSRKLYTAAAIAVISALFLNLRFNLQPREVTVTRFAAAQFLLFAFSRQKKEIKQKNRETGDPYRHCKQQT